MARNDRHRRALTPLLALAAVVGVATAAVAVAALAGCASPSERADRIAVRSGFTRDIITGARFRHVIYRNAASAAGAALHVYIEGDGTPFIQPTEPAADPTPHSPLMLQLMAQDAAASVYLGRPCYYGLAREAACAPSEWTMRRFAPEVLDSMASVLREEIARSGAARVVLFGHSGGGTLAVLLAQRVELVNQVVTLAPTLDTEAWCMLHRYAPLQGSLNPVRELAQRANLVIVHFVGERDSNTPPSLVSAAARKRGEPVHVVAGFDHVCCWGGMWRQILDTVR